MLVGRSDCLPDCLPGWRSVLKNRKCPMYGLVLYLTVYLLYLSAYLLYTEPPLFWVLFLSFSPLLVLVFRVVVVRVVPVLLLSLLSRVTLVCFSCGCCIFPVTFTELPIGLP